MIFEGHKFTATAPGAQVSHTVTPAADLLDLNPDYGKGINARRAPWVGWGEDIMMRVDITTNFVATAGDVPLVQFHVVVGAATSLVAPVIIGSNVGTLSLAATGPPVDLRPGYLVTDLVVGNHFFIRFNPFTEPMSRNSVGGAINAQTLRYMGLMLVNPMQIFAGDPGFTAGAVEGYLVKSSEVVDRPRDAIYPSGVTIK